MIHSRNLASWDIKQGIAPPDKMGLSPALVFDTLAMQRH